MKELKLLVTGTGKSGTLFMANLLTSMDFPCGHESIFTEKGIEEAKSRLINVNKIKFSNCSINELKSNWTDPANIVADSSYLAAPFLSEDFLRNAKIIHVVRNPIYVISSFVFSGGYFGDDWPPHSIDFQNFIKSNCPIVYDNNLNNINRAAIFYIEWNRMIEERSNKNNYFFYRLEDKIEILLNYLNKYEYNKNLGKKINCWNKNNLKIKLNDLEKTIRNEILEVSEKYGYHLFKL
jgi:hypothetical protein